MSKRVFIIHGWQAAPDEAWRPWLRDELIKKGFHVFLPEMPDTNYPQMNAWVNHLTEAVGIPDKRCYFVGHSLGCITILRYLETLQENQEVGGAIFVAGFVQDLDIREIANFFTNLINWEAIKKHCKHFVAIHSDDDPYVQLRFSTVFKDELDAKVITLHNMKHFGSDDGITELPVVRDELMKMI